jgi:hypothetical protein
MPGARSVDVAALCEAEQMLGLDAMVLVSLPIVTSPVRVLIGSGRMLVRMPSAVLPMAVPARVLVPMVILVLPGMVLMMFRRPFSGPRRVSPRPHLDGFLTK